SLQLQIRNALARRAETRVIHTHRLLTDREGCLERVQRFRDLSARAACHPEVLERCSNRKVIGRERPLTDLEDAAPELLGGFVASERLSHRRETREHRRNFGTIVAFASFDLE